MPRVSHDESSPKTRIRYSKGYWKDYHAAKAARAAGKLVAPPNWDASIYNPLSDLERIYTFVPGQREPLVRAAGAPLPRPSKPMTSVARKPTVSPAPILSPPAVRAKSARTNSFWKLWNAGLHTPLLMLP
ncbi:hypothetical protein FB45DRAFT_1042843 [Roridomyces roridus]|uniref:Uncharacterized protein n=1 Tax=Roridomyces roridus TaxID=1738132 RepID=A0AAD7F6J6_9AGAR|nr:hypothetical protein FB45DRAFT_1042843 [Roridomyces roridus]